MNNIITHSARLHCNTHCAFEMFTRNQNLEAWLTDYAEVEPVVGGKYELFWETTNKTYNNTRGCKITAIEPDKYLCFEWKGPGEFEDFMNHADPLTHVTIFFIPCDEVLTPCTDVYLVHSGWGSSPEWEKARNYFVQAWDIAFDQLEARVNS